MRLMLVCAESAARTSLSRTVELATLLRAEFGVEVIVGTPPHSRSSVRVALASSYRFAGRIPTVRLGRRFGRCEDRDGHVEGIVHREGVTQVLCVGVDANTVDLVSSFTRGAVPCGVLIEAPAEAGDAAEWPRRLPHVFESDAQVLCASPATDVALTRALARSAWTDERADADRGSAARRHVLDGLDAREDAFAILERLVPGLRRVSVVIPNYNYARYLRARLRSVFDQRYPVYETIVLDDASSDGSLREIRRAVRLAGRRVRLETNLENGGGVFSQWKKGVGLARGELLWIAEADDAADPGFLSATVKALDAGGAVLSFCDSALVGSRGEPLGTSYIDYYRQVDPTLFDDDFSIAGSEFARRALAERNVILNVSSVLWRREALSAALDACDDELDRYRLVGDWCLYLETLCRRQARIAYVARPLNVHRRHPTSVTHALDTDRHLVEVLAMQERARLALGPDPEREIRVSAYVEMLRAQFARSPVRGAA